MKAKAKKVSVLSETTMTVAEAAKAFGYCPQRIRALCTSGEIECKKVGRAWLTSKEEVERWLKKKGISKRTAKRPVSRRLASHGV